MLPRILKRLLTGVVWGLVLSLGSLTAYGQVHVVHHQVHHSVIVHGPCCTYYRTYAYHPYHHVVYHPYHHVYHTYHSYHVYHVYHENHLYHEYQACCPQQQVSYDYLAHDRDSGYHDGFDRGKDDAEDARCLDPYHSHHYNHSHSVAYRDAFVQGYQ